MENFFLIFCLKVFLFIKCVLSLLNIILNINKNKMNNFKKHEIEMLNRALDLLKDKCEEEVRSYGVDSYFKFGWWTKEVEKLRKKLELNQTESKKFNSKDHVIIAK